MTVAVGVTMAAKHGGAKVECIIFCYLINYISTQLAELDTPEPRLC